ncbi:hypothetical protein FBR07_04505 [Candidatus Uhrbacteria bacterium UHB]|nr:hypothetical protein [Candidatus Uhrbacteria bacterium UHB]
MLSSVSYRRNTHAIAALWMVGMLAAMAVFSFIGIHSASAAACLDTSKLPGITSDCKASAAADELDTSQSTYWFDNKLTTGPGCAPNICAVKRGSALCAALATFAKKTGTYQCVTTCAGEALSQSVPVAGSACLSGQFCCAVTAAQQQAAGGAAATAGQKAPVTGPKTLPDPLGGVNIPTLIGNVIRTFAGVAGSIALLMFVWGGISWILSGGEQAKVAQAKKTLVNASIGLVLIFAAFSFVSAIIDAILAE